MTWNLILTVHFTKVWLACCSIRNIQTVTISSTWIWGLKIVCFALMRHAVFASNLEQMCTRTLIMIYSRKTRGLAVLIFLQGSRGSPTDISRLCNCLVHYKNHTHTNDREKSLTKNKTKLERQWVKRELLPLKALIPITAFTHWYSMCLVFTYTSEGRM